MPEIKTTTPDVQLAEASAQITRRLESAITALEHEAREAIAALTDAAAARSTMATFGALLERAEHVYVKTFVIPQYRSEARAPVGRCELTFQESSYRYRVGFDEGLSSYGNERPPLTIATNKRYRAWLVLEALPEAEGG